MDPSAPPETTKGFAPTGDAEAIVRRFVGHWGGMARAWGINSSMGELFALLYISGEDWTAEDLRNWLHVSRGNVSMNLRELMTWGVVHKLHRPGERRELFRAETDVWTLFRRIMAERRRRELEPTLEVLDELASASEASPELHALKTRVEPLRRFLRMVEGLSEKLASLDPADAAELGRLLDFVGTGSDAEPGETASPGTAIS